MLVVALLFCLIIVAVLSVFASVIKAQRYNLASQQLIAQVSYVTEYMSRWIRMAKKDMDGSCITATTNYYRPSESRLEFENYNGQCQEFYLSNGQLYQAINQTEILPLTSTKFNVKNLKFSVSGETQTDTIQPRVTIFLEMEGIGGSPQPKIKIQTTVSQRDIDVQE